MVGNQPKPDGSDSSGGGGTFEPGGIAAAALVIVGTILGIFVWASLFALVQSLFPHDPPTPDTPNTPAMCSTSCGGFVKLECPTNRIMGTCFGIGICDKPVHACGTNPP
jgi:hypothetical protein